VLLRDEKEYIGILRSYDQFGTSTNLDSYRHFG
jgi:small nuclear ribonucleoprotein (snRNP)-like protein